MNLRRQEREVCFGVLVGLPICEIIQGVHLLEQAGMRELIVRVILVQVFGILEAYFVDDHGHALRLSLLFLRPLRHSLISLHRLFLFVELLLLCRRLHRLRRILILLLLLLLHLPQLRPLRTQNIHGLVCRHGVGRILLHLLFVREVWVAGLLSRLILRLGIGGPFLRAAIIHALGLPLNLQERSKILLVALHEAKGH